MKEKTFVLKLNCFNNISTLWSLIFHGWMKIIIFRNNDWIIERTVDRRVGRHRCSDCQYESIAVIQALSVLVDGLASGQNEREKGPCDAERTISSKEERWTERNRLKQRDERMLEIFFISFYFHLVFIL